MGSRVAVSAVLLVLVAGCAGLPIGESPSTTGTPTTTAPTTSSTVPTTTPTDSAPGKPFTTVSSAGCGPSFDGPPPTAQNASAAKAFALACETSRIVTPDTYVDRDATVVGRTDAGFYVRANVLAGTETGDSTGIYVVGNGSYGRVHPEYISIADEFHSEDPEQNVGQDAYLLNFGPTERTLRLTLTYANTSPPKMVFNRAYTLASGTGVELSSVTARVGTYNATVWENGDPVRSYQFALSENRSNPLYFIVEPDGGMYVTRSARR